MAAYGGCRQRGQRELHARRVNLWPGDRNGQHRPEMRLNHQPIGLPGQGPFFTDKSYRDVAATRHRCFETLQQQECQLHLLALQGGTGLPIHNEPATSGQVAQCTDDFRSRNCLAGLGGAERDAEEPYAGIGIVDAFRDEFHLCAACGPCKCHQFNPVADGTDRADKVMADTRPDQGRQVRQVCGHQLGLSKWEME